MRRPPAIVALFLLSFGFCLAAADLRLREELSVRREAVMEAMGGRGMLVLFSAEPRVYSRNIHYPYRQENNLFYLTGIRSPDTTLVLMPQNETFRSLLFLPDRDPVSELWTGRMLSREEATAISGIEHVWSAGELEPFLESVLAGRPYRTDRYGEATEYSAFFHDLRRSEANLFLLLDRRPGLAEEPTRELRLAERLRSRFPEIRIRDVSPFLHRLRFVKSEYEVEQLKRAAEITVEAHFEVMRRIRPGMFEYEVAAVVDYVFKKHNSSDWAFPSIIASGPNATVLHYEAGRRRTEAGELLLVDIGAEVNHYAADITRTLPVDGRFSPEQAAIYELVLEAQEQTMRRVRPGVTLPELHRTAVRVISKGLEELGLVTDAGSEQYRAYFPHGVGHWIGMDVHDVGPRDASLRPGMVLTVEPGLYVREDALERLAQLGAEEEELALLRSAISRYRDIGIRIEDMVAVTEEGFVHLSGELPRRIEEIEALLASRPAYDSP